MFQILTTTELANELICSKKTARNRAIKEGFETVLKEVDGRDIEAFKIPTDKLNELKSKVQKAKLKYSGSMENIEEISETVSEPYQNPTNNNVNNEQSQSFIFQIMDKYREDIYTLNDKFREEILTKDRQVLLLEDSEKRKENEYLRQIAEFKTEIEKLRAENEALKKKSGFFGIFKK